MSTLHEGHKACILLGIWGENYINHFLQFSLLSLLAPGNLPAFAKSYPTRFVFLTRSYDVTIFENHPAFLKLQTWCDVQFISINDLLGIDNYSTILTLAYDRAIRQTGKDMLNTYFLFLTSDYMMADGSLQGLMRYMQKGYSGIYAGNFQVVQEEIEPYLRSCIDPVHQVMQIQPRDLLEKSFQHLHPIVLASLFEENLAHNYRANRFFVRQNKNVLAGRFYLLHMLCIKPEILDYQIGAACDYSFVAEMCPSNHVAIIDDSDDYLVVETQSKEHELDNVKWGPYQSKKLVSALAEWTTEQHRHNATHSIYFHTQDLAPETKVIIDKKLDQFIGDVGAKLNAIKAQPYRDHPYWVAATSTCAHENPPILDIFHLTPSNYLSKWRELLLKLLGYPPTVFPWHFRWQEYHSAMMALKQHINNHSCHKTLVLYDSYQQSFIQYSQWLNKSLHLSEQYHVSYLRSAKTTLHQLQSKQFDFCLMFVDMRHLKNIASSLLTLTSMLVPGAKIVLFIPNPHNHCPAFMYDFRKEFISQMTTFFNTPYRVNNITLIHDNFSLLAAMISDLIVKRFNYNKKGRLLLYGLIGLPASIIAFFRNTLFRFFRKKGHCTNMLVTLVRDENIGMPI